jgi:glutamate N-acetyltransferase/amino-acid N-acetyltransferase
MSHWETKRRRGDQSPWFSRGRGGSGHQEAGKKDLALVFSAEPCEAAGVFTRNKVKAAPLLLDQEHLAKSQAPGPGHQQRQCQRLYGERGMADALAMAQAAAGELGLKTEEVLVASTGVIGVPLPLEKIKRELYWQPGSFPGRGAAGRPGLS